MSQLFDKYTIVYKIYKEKKNMIFVLSFMVFIFIILVFSFVLKAYPLDLNYVDIILISLVVVIIASLPIDCIAGTGTVEFGVSSILISSGVNKEMAINTAFNYHFIYIIFKVCFVCYLPNLFPVPYITFLKNVFFLKF